MAGWITSFTACKNSFWSGSRVLQTSKISCAAADAASGAPPVCPRPLGGPTTASAPCSALAAASDATGLVALPRGGKPTDFATRSDRSFVDGGYRGRVWLRCGWARGLTRETARACWKPRGAGGTTRAALGARARFTHPGEDYASGFATNLASGATGSLLVGRQRRPRTGARMPQQALPRCPCTDILPPVPRRRFERARRKRRGPIGRTRPAPRPWWLLPWSSTSRTRAGSRGARAAEGAANEGASGCDLRSRAHKS